jgi:MATE family multidrug resistance protein
MRCSATAARNIAASFAAAMRFGSIRETLRALLKLSVPSIVAQLGQVALSVVDASFAAKLGVDALDAVTLGSTFQFSTMLPLSGIVMGMAPLVSQAEGAGRAEAAGLALQRALVIAGLLSLAVLGAWRGTEFGLCALGQSPALAHAAAQYVDAQLFSAPCFLIYSALSTYLSSRGIVHVGILVMLAANLFNALAAWSLMFGHLGMPALGIQGAAIATGLTELLLPTVMALLIVRNKLYAGGWTPWSVRAFAWPGLLRQLRFGLPNGLTYALELWAFQLGTLLAGRLDPVALGAHAITLNLASLSFVVPLGFASGASALVGQLIVAGKRERAQAAAHACLSLLAGYSLCACALFVFARELLPALYSGDARIVAAAAAVLPIAGAFQLFDGLSAGASAVLRAMGHAKLTAIANLLAYFGLGIPLAFYLSAHTTLGLSGIWLGYAAGLLTVAAFLVSHVLWRGPLSAQPLSVDEEDRFAPRREHAEPALLGAGVPV